jgi:hypothetical protein
MWKHLVQYCIRALVSATVGEPFGFAATEFIVDIPVEGQSIHLNNKWSRMAKWTNIIGNTTSHY